METITRKSMLYPTKVEYGDYCMNHVLGCSHNCIFCYAYALKRRFGKVLNRSEWATPKLVSNTIDLLHKEIPRLKDKIESAQLCFCTDPFQAAYPEIAKMTIDSIKLLNSYGIPCHVLTKGVYLVDEMKDLSKINSFGITLSSLSPEYTKKYEGDSALPAVRLQALRQLKDEGFHVWISMEPYPTPNMCSQSLTALLEEISWVDHIVFGRCNYFKEATSYLGHKEFFHQCALDLMEYCKEHNISYHIKAGTMLEN